MIFSMNSIVSCVMYMLFMDYSIQKYVKHFQCFYWTVQKKLDVDQ